MTARYTRDQGFTRARRIGRDQEESRKELDEMFDDPDTTAGELIAALIAHCDDDREEELHNSLRELGQDKRGPRSWARDKLALRRHARDRRPGRDRKMGRDLSEAELTSPGRFGSIEEFDNRSRDRDSTEIDRRAPRTAADMAFDAQSRRNPSLASFRSRYPNASRIERF